MNVILVVTDDQEIGTVDADAMPYLAGNPHGNWVELPNAVCTTPLCYPFRVSVMTGQRTDHHGKDDNGNVDVGMYVDDANMLAPWLSAAGYRTGHVGKYLNYYPWARGPFVPEGWDYWFSIKANPSEAPYFDWTAVNGDLQEVTFGDDPTDYVTDVLRDRCLDFIEQDDGRPWFLHFAPNAPHEPFTPAPRHEAVTMDTTDPDDFNQADVSTQPAWVQALDSLSAQEQTDARTHRANARRCLLSVDEAIEAILDAVDTAGQMDDTAVFFLTDNGYSHGRKRLSSLEPNSNSKRAPYRWCITSSLRIRYPGATQRTDTALASTVDVTATICGIAGASPTLPPDGLDLRRVLLGDIAMPRTGIESYWTGDVNRPAWRSYREGTHNYIWYPTTGEEELYDWSTDPAELVNIASANAVLCSQYRQRLNDLMAYPHGHRTRSARMP